MPPAFPPLPTLRNLRWSSGLVLWAYVALHLFNHSLGLASLALAERWRQAQHALLDSLPGSLLLYGAFGLHLALALAGLWRRGSLRMPAIEALRVLLGLSLPLLLAGHFTATRWAAELHDLPASYARLIPALWTPQGLGLQWLLLVAAWGHGCLGLHLALRRRALWRRWQPLLLVLAVLLPALAAVGVLGMARELAWTPHTPVQQPGAAQAQALGHRALALRYGWLLVLAALVAARLLRHLRAPRQAQVLLHFPQQTVQVPQGWSVLEACRDQGIALMSLCGGQGRCSTCRVRVQGDAAHLPAPGRDELRTLQRVHAPADVRLACQLRPCGPVAVEPLLAPPLPQAARQAALAPRGQERAVAVLFVDLRSWSGLAERQWPMDLVYVLDRYFALVGETVREMGGLPNQYIGDSVMALFGLDSTLPTACLQAVRAAARIEQRMQAWSAEFEAQFGQPLDFGMGLHAGPVAVGQVGYQETTTFSAVGEVVNTASRLQDLCKQVDARLVLSQEAARQAGIADQLGAPTQVAVRGRSTPLAVLHTRHPARLQLPADAAVPAH